MFIGQFSQKYAIVQFLELVNVGAEFMSNEWPLHSTVVDTFAIDWSVDEMVAELTKTFGCYDAVTSEAEVDRFFGENGQTQVVLIKRTQGLVKLHQDVLTVLDRGGIALNDPQFAHDGFLPHATVQEHARLQKGDSVYFTALSIVDMFPDNDPYRRRVLAKIPLVSRPSS